nr:MAG TPA: hypothetical protein [Caudoviricetes sp.]
MQQIFFQHLTHLYQLLPSIYPKDFQQQLNSNYAVYYYLLMKYLDFEISIRKHQTALDFLLYQ